MLNNIFGFTGPTVRIGDFSFTFSVASIVEILIFAVLIYYLIRWVKSTNSWNALKGIGILLLAYLLSLLLGLNTFTYIFTSLFASIVLAVIILFQPEIRQALSRIGKNNLIQRILGQNGKDNTELNGDSIDAICHALGELGKDYVGALIIVERNVDLTEYCETGISLDSKISAALLEQIFVHNTPLHDGAVIIRRNKIVAATCYLPLSDNSEISKELGTRHRAGLGISEKSDCITLIASEETGDLSVAVNGVLTRKVSTEYIREVLVGIRMTSTKENKKTSEKSRKGRKAK